MEEKEKQEQEQEQEKVEDDVNEQGENSSFSSIKVVLITLAVIVIIGVTGAGIGGYYVYSNLQPVNPESDELVQVEVPMGSSGTRIATILKENNLIKNEKIFYYYVRYKGASGFQAGEYYLSAASSPDQIIEQLKDGRVHVESERFTIPEGLSVEQIATHLESLELVDAATFLQVVNEVDFSQFSFIEGIPDVEHRKYRLEGFLFPETYDIKKGADEEEIIRVMLGQFEKELKDEWTEELQKRDLTFYDAVTLASIVEREAVLDEERKTIAGVFLNRMKDEWLLQSCATVQFVLGKQRDRLLFEDLEVESPYNTYINPGLPPSPIASPGRESLMAVIHPEEHSYYFFVTKKDDSGAHHFSKTYEEHLRNDAQSRGNF